MNFYHALERYLDAATLRRIALIKVGIAGLGGLGSNCALNLVRSGFRYFELIDFDTVEASNLNRQFYFADQIGQSKAEALQTNLHRINPELMLNAHRLRLTASNIHQYFHDCDAVVEAFDAPEAKSMIVTHFLRSGKFIVAGSGLAGWGNLDNVKVHRLKENLAVIGDLNTAVDIAHPPLSPRVNMAAAMMADVILEWAITKG